MGDPKKFVSTYSGPRHPWEKQRIEEEKVLLREYGLKNKKDIWKETSYVKKIKDHIKKVNATVGVGIALEKEALVKKLLRYNLLQDGQGLDQALDLTTRDVMERRLQTQVVRAGLARSMKQARQFIVHGHITVHGQKITSPSYMVSKEEQFAIDFIGKSSLADPEHPERKAPEAAEVVTETKTEGDDSSKVIDGTKDAEKVVKGKEESVDEEVSKEISEKIEDSAAEDIVTEDKKEEEKAETKEDVQ